MRISTDLTLTRMATYTPPGNYHLSFPVWSNLNTIRTYRDFVNDTGQSVAVQAGPNGPENVVISWNTFTLLVTD